MGTSENPLVCQSHMDLCCCRDWEKMKSESSTSKNLPPQLMLLRAGFADFCGHQSHQERLLKHGLLGPTPRVFDNVHLGRGLRTCILTSAQEFLVGGLGTTNGEPVVLSFPG